METNVQQEQKASGRRTTWILAALPPGGAIIGAIYAVLTIFLSVATSDSELMNPGIFGVALLGAAVGLFFGGFVGLLGAAGGFLAYLIRTRHRLVVTTLGAVLGASGAWALILGIPASEGNTSADLTMLVTAIVSVIATGLFVGGLPLWIRKGGK